MAKTKKVMMKKMKVRMKAARNAYAEWRWQKHFLRNSFMDVSPSDCWGLKMLAFFSHWLSGAVGSNKLSTGRSKIAGQWGVCLMKKVSHCSSMHHFSIIACICVTSIWFVIGMCIFANHSGAPYVVSSPYACLACVCVWCNCALRSHVDAASSRLCCMSSVCLRCCMTAFVW